MQLTEFEKLALTLLCEMYNAHGIEDGLDSKFIQMAIAGDQTWAISERYGDLVFRSEFHRPPNVSEVIYIIQMCVVIEESCDKLSKRRAWTRKHTSGEHFRASKPAAKKNNFVP